LLLWGFSALRFCRFGCGAFDWVAFLSAVSPTCLESACDKAKTAISIRQDCASSTRSSEQFWS
jgi:hypothetical protein